MVLPSGGPNLGKKVPCVLPVSRRNHLRALFPKPKSSTMAIAEVTPRQLAPSVGTLHVGSAIPAASSSSTLDSATIYDAIYFDSEAAAKSITFGSFDFTPHSPMSNLVFKLFATAWIWRSEICTSTSTTLASFASRTRFV